MILGEPYKHKSNTDVAFVADSIVDQQDRLILAVRWYNIVNQSNIFFINYDEIEIKNADIEKWERINVSTRGVF
jgi:hypothetical protein